MELYYCNYLEKYVSYGENSINLYSNYIESFITKEKCPLIGKDSYITIVNSILDSLYLENSIFKLDDFYSLPTFHFYFYFGDNNISFYNHVITCGTPPIQLDQNEKEKLIKEVRNVIYK